MLNMKEHHQTLLTFDVEKVEQWSKAFCIWPQSGIPFYIEAWAIKE